MAAVLVEMNETWVANELLVHAFRNVSQFWDAHQEAACDGDYPDTWKQDSAIMVEQLNLRKAKVLHRLTTVRLKDGGVDIAKRYHALAECHCAEAGEQGISDQTTMIVSGWLF